MELSRLVVKRLSRLTRFVLSSVADRIVAHRAVPLNRAQRCTRCLQPFARSRLRQPGHGRNRAHGRQPRPDQDGHARGRGDVARRLPLPEDRDRTARPLSVRGPARGRPVRVVRSGKIQGADGGADPVNGRFGRNTLRPDAVAATPTWACDGVICLPAIRRGRQIFCAFTPESTLLIIHAACMLTDSA